MTLAVPFVFGAVVGSFLNVFALRLNTGLALGDRSGCLACGKKLQWYELLPIISFFVLRARCAGCGVKISWQYPLVELWTALIFITVPLVLIPTFCIYIVITIYDFRHKIIPDNLVYASILLSFLTAYFLLPATALDWFAGPILFGFFAIIWFLSRGKAMGFGDAKLALSIGLLLGTAQGFSALVLAFWLGAVFGILWLIKSKNITMKSEVPFAPFIILGAWIAVIFQLDLLNVSLF